MFYPFTSKSNPSSLIYLKMLLNINTGLVITSKYSFCLQAFTARTEPRFSMSCHIFLSTHHSCLVIGCATPILPHYSFIYFPRISNVSTHMSTNRRLQLHCLFKVSNWKKNQRKIRKYTVQVQAHVLFALGQKAESKIVYKK